jgi:hypothetical protein
MMLVSVNQASDYLRRDTTADDSLLLLLVQSASQAVVSYLQTASWLDSDGEIALDSDGEEMPVPAAVQWATLHLIGFLYRNRDANPDQAFAPGYLPAPVTALLYPHRDPVCA